MELDAYSPSQMAARVEKAGISKGNMDFFSMFTLAILAGAFIAFGAVLFTYVVHDSNLSLGLTKLLGGLAFCLGLVLVIVAGAELFTGNNLIVMAFVSRKITLTQLLRNWGIVFLGNFIGSLAIVFLIALSGQWFAGNAAVGVKALMIANSKVNLTFLQALSRGILCNTLVCLAVWLCFSGRSVTDKILAIIFPITAFVALGFEHSIANMYFIPAGLLVKSPKIIAAAQTAFGANLDLSNLTTYNFFMSNLLPVTIGNILGGSLFIAGIYWFVYLRRSAAEPIRHFMTSGPPSISSGSTVKEAVEIMKRHSSGSIIVGEISHALGLVSEADIVRKVVAAGKDPASVKVDLIMSVPLISLDIKTPVYQIYRTMADKKIRHLFITENGKLTGFVSVKDLLSKSNI